MSRPVKQGLSDTYKCKLCLSYICEFLRATDSTREWGRSIKEISLLEFQQWIGAKIPPEEEEWLSQKPESIRQRKWRQWVKQKKDYEELLRQMRAEAKNG